MPLPLIVAIAIIFAAVVSFLLEAPSPDIRGPGPCTPCKGRRCGKTVSCPATAGSIRIRLF